MALSEVGFILLLAAVAAGRLLELRISKRNRARLAALGARAVPDPHFPCMVLLHAGVLVGAAVEVLLLRRPFVPPLAVAAAVLLALACALRFWAIGALAVHWNVRVVSSVGLGVVSTGPYRFVRHPNYVAVFVEMIALPLVHTAWITAVAGAAAHVFVLQRRIEAEEAALLADPGYRSVMGPKPRFVPVSFRAR